MTANQIARQDDCLELMREILGQAERSSVATGLAKVDRLLDRASRAQGSADFATLIQPIDAARAKRSGTAMHKEAVERLKHMFMIDVEAERTRRALMRKEYEALPVFRKGRPVIA
jgi:predicted homoserine dehydrogenase-like protein